jgi:protein-L-isoaspartate O-methyltransferase
MEALLASVADRSVLSPELRQAIQDWTAYYHLSASRSLALRPVRPLLRGRVLETAAECGALTRFLGETGSEITALETDADMYSAARLRCSDLPNVTVVNGSIDDLAEAERFDVIVARLADASMDPHALCAFLADLKERLQPAGRLILLACNQVWPSIASEAAEAPAAQPDGRLPVSRQMLETSLRSSGFSSREFGFVFPDGDVPTTVLSADALTSDQFDASSFFDARTIPYRRPGAEAPALNWSLLARTGLLGDFAKGFLVVASREAPQEPALPGLVHFYSINRTRAFAKETIIEDRGGVLQVRRRRLAELAGGEPAPGASGLFRSVLEDEPWRNGEAYDKGLARIVQQDGWSAEDIARWAAPWLEFLQSSATLSGERVTLPPNFVDCVPFNIVVSESGRLIPFDLEYAAREPLEIEFVLLRGLWGTLVRQERCALPQSGTSHNALELARTVVELLGVPLDEHRIADLIAIEVHLQHEVTGAPLDHEEYVIRHQTIAVPQPAAEVSRLEQFLCQLFWRSGDAGYSEDHSSSIHCPVGAYRYMFRLPLPPLESPLQGLRWDMADRPGILQVHELYLLDAYGRVTWRLRDFPGISAFSSAEQTVLMADPQTGVPVTFFMAGSDPSVELAISGWDQYSLRDGGALVVEYTWPVSREALLPLTGQLQDLQRALA